MKDPVEVPYNFVYKFLATENMIGKNVQVILFDRVWILFNMFNTACNFKLFNIFFLIHINMIN